MRATRAMKGMRAVNSMKAATAMMGEEDQKGKKMPACVFFIS
jgi:hypothetical protein